MLTPAQQQLQVAFNRQIEWCTQLGSPFMVRLLAVSRDLLITDAALAEQFLTLVPDPGPGLVALRFTGALHALALQGHEPWASLWPSTAPAGSQATDAALIQAVHLAVTSQWLHIKNTLRSAPQTNEVRRSAVLLPGWLHVAKQTGLPLALVEIGASAGLNLWADKWLHDHGTWTWPGDREVRITSEWRGPPPVGLTQPSTQPSTQPPTLHIASRRACDILPIDITQAAQRQRLASYVWPDQTERLQLLDAALSKAASWASLSGLKIEAVDAASYLQRELHTLPAGQTTLVFHSIVWQYLSGPERQRLQAVITAAGARATATSPLAWLSYEFSAADQPAQLRCRIWPSVQPRVETSAPPSTQPDGDEQLLAHAHPHGAWVEWVAGSPGLQ